MDLLSTLTMAASLAVSGRLHNPWARRTHQPVAGCRLHLIHTGPISAWGRRSGPYTFHIEAPDVQGRRRTGYACAVGYFPGLLRDRMEVRRDTVPATAGPGMPQADTASR